MRRRAVAVLGICWHFAAASLALGCEPRDTSPLGRGRRIFQRSCSGCHGADGKGVMRMGLAKPPRDLTRPEFQAQMSDEQLRQSIRYGKGQMPAFGGLMADEDINHVITFIRSFVPQPTPPAAPGAAGTPEPVPAEAQEARSQ